MTLKKDWGTTEILFKTPFLEVHRIVVEPRMSCSMHKHEKKWNAFLILSGKLDIEHESGELVGSIAMSPRGTGFHAVPPGDFHRFVTGAEQAVAYELYFPDVLSEDIVRRTTNQLITPLHAAITQECDA